MSFKRIITTISILILVFILQNTVSSIRDLAQNEGTVQDLRMKLIEKKKENDFLTQRLSYVKSNEFVEFEAREKLGLVRENEYPVFLTPPDSIGYTAPVEEKANWVKWKEIFRL